VASDPSPAHPSRVRRFALWSAALLLVLSFVGGVLVGRRPIAALTRRTQEAETRADSAEARFANADAHLQVYRALSLVNQTIVDLDAQNFGVANTRLDEAVAALDRVDRARVGAAAPEIDAVRNALAGQDIQLTPAPEGQRAVLSDLARRLAAALGG
jgi:hypothetical protein